MFCIVWEFTAGPGCEAEFQEAYSPAGAWAALFRKSEGYLGTELLRDLERAGRYLTIDRWDSAASYENFRKEHGVEYTAIDERCRNLTTMERHVGSYECL